MRILDRYITKSILNIFILCLFVFILLYIIIDVLSFLDEILKHQVSFRTLIQYYLLYIPIIFTQVAPFSCLLATIYTFAKLNRDSEIIAMRASGLNIFDITKTVIIFGFVISILVFWTNSSLVPLASAFKQKIKYSIENTAKKNQNKNKEVIINLSMYGLKNSLFFINRFTPATKTMEGIIILEHDKFQNIIRKIVANKGVFKNGKWIFYQNITYDFDAAGQLKTEPKFAVEEIMAIPETPNDFLTQSQQPYFMTTDQLKGYLLKLKKSGADTVIRNLKVDLYQRYMSPLLSVFIILLAIPFALKIKKYATGISSLGISIIMAFSYYVINAISVALGKAGFIAPILAASLSHILALALSFYLIIKLS